MQINRNDIVDLYQEYIGLFHILVFIIVVSSHNMTAVISMPFVYTFLIITSHRLPTAINVSTLAFSKVSSIQEVFFVKSCEVRTFA